MPGAFTYDPASKRVTVIGGNEASPADFSSWVAADRAGTLTLWTGTPATGITLTNQVRPCEKLALPLDFIIAGATDIGAGDTIGITGTDAWGQVQNETLATEASGTFTTSKRWRTITNVDCNGFVTGTLTIRQPQWGVIWDKGNNQYQLDALFQVGDGVTSTCFKEWDRQIVFSDFGFGVGSYLITAKANAVCQLGYLVDESKKATSLGCSVISVSTIYHHLFKRETGATFNLYSCQARAGYASKLVQGNALIGNMSRIWNTLLNRVWPDWNLEDIVPDIYNMTITSSNWGFRYNGGATLTLSRIFTLDTNQSVAQYGSGDLIIWDSEFIKETGIYYNGFSGNTYLINCLKESWEITWTGTPKTGSLYRQYTLDLKVSDKEDTAISGAAVKIYDQDGNLVADLASGADGKIAQQHLNYKRYYWDGAATAVQDYYPYRLVISKAGYETYEDKLDLDRKMDLEVALASYQPRHPLEVELPALAPLEVSLKAARLEVEIHG